MASVKQCAPKLSEIIHRCTQEFITGIKPRNYPSQTSQHRPRPHPPAPPPSPSASTAPVPVRQHRSRPRPSTAAPYPSPAPSTAPHPSPPAPPPPIPAPPPQSQFACTAAAQPSPAAPHPSPAAPHPGTAAPHPSPAAPLLPLEEEKRNLPVGRRAELLRCLLRVGCGRTISRASSSDPFSRASTSVAGSCLLPRLIPSWIGRGYLHALLHKPLGAIFRYPSCIFAIHLHIEDPLEML
jgi:hypothetical protein